MSSDNDDVSDLEFERSNVEYEFDGDSFQSDTVQVSRDGDFASCHNWLSPIEIATFNKKYIEKLLVDPEYEDVQGDLTESEPS